MDRNNSHILVIDPQAERAQEINSLLRNSGINVHVSHAADAVDMERLLRDLQPALCLLHPAAVPGVPLDKVCEAVARHRALLAILCTTRDVEVLKQALEECACIGVNADDPGQLTALVRHINRNGHTGRDLALLESHLAETQELYELLLNSTGDPVAYIHEGLHVAANAPYRAALGIRDDSALASLSLLELLRSEDRDLKALVRELGQGRCPATPLTVTVQPPTAEAFQARAYFSPARYQGEPCVQVLLRPLDVHGDIAPAPVLPHEERDPLTGALTRQAFMRALQRRLGSIDPQQHCALLYLQPDGGEQLVHELAPGQLDDYLLTLADAVRGHLQDAELLGRLGDCTFTVLALRSGKDELRQLGEKLLQQVGELGRQAENRGVPASASLGLLPLGEHDLDAGTALDQVRAAWRAASGAGDSLQPYRPALAATADQADDQQWLQRLRYALNNDDLYTVRQTIVDLDGNGEGLFENHTFLHEDNGDQPASAFLPAAERNALASSVDRHVIPGLLHAISGGGDRHIINISGNSVLDFSFPGWFQRQLQTADVEGRQVVLQIPAQAALADLRSTRRLIEELAPMGCAFSIAGIEDNRKHEALPEQLRLAYIKLAPELILGLPGNPARQQAVRRLVNVARHAGTEVLADQVLNSADVAALWQCGVKHMAGEFLQESSRVAG